MQDLDCLEIFDETQLTIQNIEITSVHQLKNFLKNQKISSIVYNKKKFSHISVCEENLSENLSSLKEDSILFISGIHSLSFSKPIFLKKNQTLYSSQNKQSQIFQIHLQENARQIQIINLKIQNLYSKIQLSSSPLNQNSFLKLNDNCEINGLNFEFISNNHKLCKALIEAEYKGNIILKNLKFSASETKKELCFIELYKTHKFEFINNHAKDHILLKIICADSRFGIIKSDFPNNSKIQFFNPDIFHFENIKLHLLGKNIENIRILNSQTSKIHLQNKKNHLFLINYFDSNSLNFDFSFLNQSKNQNFFFFGLQKSENFFFSFSNYSNLELKLTNNFTKLKYISFSEAFQDEVVQNNLFHFQNIFLKINQDSFNNLNQIQILNSSKILIELSSKQSINFSENFFNWRQNSFLFKANDYAQNLFQINHSFRIDEIEKNFFLQNKFIFDKKKLNLIDTKFLFSKIFIIKKNLFKENSENLKTLIIENQKFNQTIEKIFANNQNNKKFFLIVLPQNNRANLNFFLINSKEKSIENIDQKISKIEKSFYFQNLKSNLEKF